MDLRALLNFDKTIFISSIFKSLQFDCIQNNLLHLNLFWPPFTDCNTIFYCNVRSGNGFMYYMFCNLFRSAILHICGFLLRLVSWWISFFAARIRFTVIIWLRHSLNKGIEAFHSTSLLVLVCSVGYDYYCRHLTGGTARINHFCMRLHNKTIFS